MDDRFLPARDAANAFWTKVAYISLDSSLNRRLAALTRLSATTADARVHAGVVYESKMHIADEIFETTTAPAKAIRDEACAEALEIFARSIEAPGAILEAAKKANDAFFETYRNTCANVLRLATWLAQEEFEVAFEEAHSDEEREQARLLLQSTKQAAQQKHVESDGTGMAMWNAKHREATEEFNRATASARSTCRDVTEAHNRAFADISEPANLVRATAVREAYDQRETLSTGIEAEHQRQFELIQSQYAVERRLRVAGLRTSRILVDAYYDWLSNLTSPASR